MLDLTMRIRTWLRDVFSNDCKYNARRKLSKRIALGVESLEDRYAPATINVTVFHGGEISGSVFIIGGRLKSDPPKNSIVIENSRKSAQVKCFSVEDIGLKMVHDAKILRVANVTPGSKAALSGFKVGDILLTDIATDDPLTKLERNITRAYAGFKEITLTIRRNDRAEKIVLSFDE